MAAINGTSIDDARRAADQAYLTWRTRSLRRWRVRVEPHLLSSYPDLQALEGLSALPRDGKRRMAQADARRST